MTLSDRNIVAVAEMAAYAPIFVLAILACNRHGFSKSSGFYFILTLSVFRIAGSACQLATIANPTSVGLITAAVVFDHIGLTAVMMSTLGMLSRLGDWVNKATGSPVIGMRIFRLVQLVMMLGAIFIIVGMSSSSPASGSSGPSTWSYVSAVLYVVGYILLVLLYIKTISHGGSIPKGERSLMVVVGFSLPLVLVRLAWTVLSVFVHSGVFSASSTDIWVHVFMATVEEFLVAVMYVGMAFKLRPLDESEQGELQARPWKNRNGGGRRRGGRRARRRQEELDELNGYNGGGYNEYGQPRY